MKEQFILVRYGEIALKKRETRRRFEHILKKNITSAFESHGVDCFVETSWGRLFVHTSDITKGIDVLTHVFGITSVSPVVPSTSDLQQLSVDLLIYLNGILNENTSFALRVTRTGNQGYTSQDAASRLGDIVRSHFLSSVNLNNPDIEVFIEIRDARSFIYLKKFPGPGGMPMGSQGRICSLISSEDDVLAAWFLLKRGCSMVFFVADSTVESKINRLIDRWNVSLKIFYKKDNRAIFHELSRVLNATHCEALCIGVSLSIKGEQTMQVVNDLKEQIDKPLLTPLITQSSEGIGQIKQQVELGE